MHKAIEKLSQLAANLIQNNPQASPEQLAQELQQALQSDSELAASFRQNNYGHAKGFQTLVTGGVAYIGDNFHVDKEALQAVLEIFLQKYSFSSLPQLDGNPFIPPQPREGGLFGREEELTRLHELLQSGKNVCVVSGMGGVGKTRLVREYAQRPECTTYFTGGIYYIDVRNRENLAEGIVALTKWRFKIELPAYLKPSENVTYCWQQWKGQTENILLILDDVSNLTENLKCDLLPKDLVTMRLLMTSRETPNQRVAEKLELEVLSEQAAVELLAAIIGQPRIDAEPEEAKLLCDDLGYLPLALELVAYYLDDEDYQQLTLAKMRQKLKAKVKHPALSPEAVPMGMQAKRGLQAAFDLSWDKLKPEAKHLACVLAAFAPSPIHWGFVTKIYQRLQGESFSEDDLKDRWLKSLRKLHFVMTVEEDIYNLHLLIHDYFNEYFKSHPQHSQIKQAFCDVFAVTASKIDQSSNIVIFVLIEPHLRKIIAWCESNEDTRFALSLHGLATLYYSQGQYNNAELLYLQSLEIRKRQLGADHSNVASGLNNLALLYVSQGKYSNAELLFLQSLEIWKRQLGADHPDVATSLNNLALLYESQGKYSNAEPLYLQSLEIRKRQLGADHPDVATSLNNLALLYEAQGKYSTAELLYLQSLEIWKRQLGADHPNVASSLNNLASLYKSQGKYSDAELLFLQSLEIWKRQLGADHPNVATSLNNLASLYKSQGKYSDAEPLYLQFLEIRKRQLGADHPDVATSLNNLALLYEAQGKYSNAEPLYLQSLEIWKHQLGADHPNVAQSLNNLAMLYKAQNKYQKAEELAKQALAIYQKVLGEQHSNTQNAELTIKFLHIMMLLHCNEETLFGILQAFAQQANLPQLNTETMLVMLEAIENNPELLLYLREALHQDTEASDDNT